MLSSAGSARAAAPIVALASLLGVASVAVTAVKGLDHVVVALWFVAFITIGEVVRVVLPGDRESAPLAAAGALAYALLPTWGGESMEYGVAQVVSVVAIASLLGSVPHLVAARATRLEDLGRRLVVVAVVAAVFRPMLGWLEQSDNLPLMAAVMVLVALLGTVVDGVLAAVVRAGRDRAPFRRALIDEGRAVLGIGSAITATGVLIALAANSMGPLSLVVFSVPLLLTQFSFRRYASIRATYLQTIRSLSRVTDVGGYTEAGHAQRVARLAMSVGRELGLSEAALLDLEYAALMHDIGQLSLQDPIPGGATSATPPQMQRRIAELGAAVIHEASVMGDVATIVERQADPYRLRGVRDTTLPLECRIIRVCNAYDDQVGASLDDDRRARALETLRADAGGEYDPRVLESLTRLVSRGLVPARA